MKRKIKERSRSVLEEIVRDSLFHVGLKPSVSQAALLLRLIFSGIGRHFYFEPDTRFKIGFINIEKSPDVDELFRVLITRSPEDKVINADTLFKYYMGDLAREEKMRDLLDTFVNELLAYSQAQEISITSMTTNISNNEKK